MMQFIHPYF